MALSAMRVPTVFTAVDRFSSVVDRMTGTVSAFGQTAQAAAMRTSRKMNNMGTGMLYTGAAMAVGLGYGISEAVKYEKAITNLAAVTGTQVGSMNKYIEDLHKETKRSVIDIAKSFEIVGSKMSQYLDNPVALQKITKASILMADAASMELEPAINSLTQMMNIYRMSAENAYRVVNKLSAGETVGSISIAQTADILPQFGAQAVRANVNIEESIALIQTLVKSLPVAGVGRGLRNILFDISSTETWDKNKWRAVKDAGVDFKFVTDNANDLTARLRELKKLSGTKGATELFFKRINSIAANTLFQNFDKEGFTEFLGKIKGLNDAQEKANKNNATLSKRWMDLKATVQLLAIKIGTQLLPKLSELVDVISPVIQKTTLWAEKNGKLIKAVFYLTMGVLAMGVALKVAAFYTLGYARALAIVEFATKAYTGAVWFMSLGLEGAATAATLAAASIWATLWPLALFGAAVWAVVDMVQHWEDWKEVIGLCIGPLGWVALLLDKISKHSDNINNKFAFEGWGSGIESVGTMLEDMILSPLIAIFNIMGRLPLMGSPFKEMAADLQSVKTKLGSETTLGYTGLQGAANFSTFGGLVPAISGGNVENTAGKNQGITNELLKIFSKQEIEVVLSGNTENAAGVKVNGKNYFNGIPAKTESTTGLKK